jgi:hypothetical protein
MPPMSPLGPTASCHSAVRRSSSRQAPHAPTSPKLPTMRTRRSHSGAGSRTPASNLRNSLSSICARDSTLCRLSLLLARS